MTNPLPELPCGRGATRHTPVYCALWNIHGPAERNLQDNFVHSSFVFRPVQFHYLAIAQCPYNVARDGNRNGCDLLIDILNYVIMLYIICLYIYIYYICNIV